MPPPKKKGGGGGGEMNTDQIYITPRIMWFKEEYNQHLGDSIFALIAMNIIMNTSVNPLKTSPEYTLAWGLWEMCVIAKSNRLQRG